MKGYVTTLEFCFSSYFVFREEMWRLDFGKGGWTE